MFGPKLTTVFASRWNALFWAGGVLLTAYCSIPDAPVAEDAAQPAASATANQPFDTSEIDRLTKELEELEKQP